MLNPKVISEVLGRITQLANAHVNSSFKTEIYAQYNEIYGDQISPAWFNKLHFSVSITELVQDEVGFLEQVIPQDVDQEESTYGTVPEIEEFIPKSGDEFRICVYQCKSVTDIWGALTDSGHVGKVGELSSQMDSFYRDSLDEMKSVRVGSYYAILLNRSWHRVKCLSSNELTAEVFFIDRGDQGDFLISKLRPLDSTFYCLVAQAVRMTMSGLTMFSTCVSIESILNKMLLNRIFLAKTNHVDCVKNYNFSVDLYLQDDKKSVHINTLIMDELYSTDLNPRSFIQTVGMVKIMTLHISLRQIFVQYDADSSRILEQLMKALSEQYLADDLVNGRHVCEPDEHTLYLVRNRPQDTWHRGKILKRPDKTLAEIFLVDLGIFVNLDGTNHILFDKLSGAIAKYPFQALEVQLHQLPPVNDEKMLSRLATLTEKADALYLQFIAMTSDGRLPLVKILRKSPTSSFYSLNDILLLASRTIKDDLFQENSEVDLHPVPPLNNIKLEVEKNHNAVPFGRNESFYNENSYISCKYSSVPENDFFDVHVVAVSSPSQFIIQLLKNRTMELMGMVCKMSRKLDTYESPRLTRESVKFGCLYAFKSRDDDLWHRGYVIDIICKKFATVYCCDNGNFINVMIPSLVPLPNEFHQIPCQAIWAKLNGIVPRTGIWKPRDRLKFKELAESKNFVAIVKNKVDVRSLNNENFRHINVGYIYEIELIDTSTNEDVYLTKLLVNQGRALRKN